MENQIIRAKVLVVDDEPANVELISGYLEKYYDIIPAYSGKEALEKVIVWLILILFYWIL